MQQRITSRPLSCVGVAITSVTHSKNSRPFRVSLWSSESTIISGKKVATPSTVGFLEWWYNIAMVYSYRKLSNLGIKNGPFSHIIIKIEIHVISYHIAGNIGD